MKTFNFEKKENFFTEQEVEIIRQGVWDLKSEWKHAHTYPVASPENIAKHDPQLVEWAKRVSENMYFLGDAIYVLDDKIEYLNRDVQDKLTEKFGWLYDKTITFFKEFYQTENVKLHEKLPHPGFHVFTGNPQERRPFDWHIDTPICGFESDIDQTTIYSFIALIQATEDQPHLEYTMTDPNTDVRILKYDFNHLYMWRGLIQHRIGPFILKDSEEARITFQGHIYYDKKDNYYKIYF
jgi:hypothetical protein